MSNLEAATGFEPVIRVLQTRALPLGYAAGQKKAGNGIRTRDIQLGKLTLYQLSYSRKHNYRPDWIASKI